MGAWGYGIYDNDIAMDCRDTFGDLVTKGLGKLDALNELKQGWAFQYSESILVIADLQINITGKLDDITKRKTVKALEEEISRAGLWNQPEERMEKLNQFKSKLDKY